MKSRFVQILLTAILATSVLSGCNPRTEKTPEREEVFRILSGSENESLEPILQTFADDEKIQIEITYAGSVDIMLELENGPNSAYDAVWPANSMWIQLGDSSGTIQASASIMRSPVVLAVKKSIATNLGWVGAEVGVNDILAATEAGQLHFMMANASQSDSGASAYLGFLYAFSGQPDILSSTNLQDPTVQDKIKRILGQVDRTSGSSAQLKDAFLEQFDSHDAMFNYESVVIEANQELVADGREPLYAIYPFDGTAISDSPFAYIDKSDPAKRETYTKLQQHLLSEGIQRELLKRGRRAGLGINPDPSIVDLSVFNPDWGIDTQRILTPIRTPEADVIREAINLYQTTFRKPSFTVYALDYSGSMAASGQEELKSAMTLLLDQTSASRFFLQASPTDVTVVITFNHQVMDVWTVTGNDSSELLQLAARIEQKQAAGGTDIYSPVIRGLEVMKEHGIDGYFPSIVLLTDGESQDGKDFGDLSSYVALSSVGEVPVFAITFGNASTSQLQEIAELTAGQVFDGKVGLAGVFRKVKGYN